MFASCRAPGEVSEENQMALMCEVVEALRTALPRPLTRDPQKLYFTRILKDRRNQEH